MIAAARRWMKAGAARLLSGALPRTRHVPVVIGYHRVVENFEQAAETSIPSMLVSLARLEEHLDWLARRYRFVNLDELGAMVEAGVRFDRPAAAVTFDDGYRDFCDLALPLLRRKGIPAAVFAITGHVGTSKVQPCDRLYLLFKRRVVRGLSREDPYESMRRCINSMAQVELEEHIGSLEAEDPIPAEMYRPFHSVTWEQLAAAHRQGAIVGSHTQSHAVMTLESRPRLRAEAHESRSQIAQRLNSEVRHFAYPNGSFDSIAVDAVAGAGYRFAYTTCAHRYPEHPLLTIPRTLLWENSSLDAHRAFSGAVLNCQIQGAFGFAAACTPHGQQLERRA